MDAVTAAKELNLLYMKVINEYNENSYNILFSCLLYYDFITITVFVIFINAFRETLLMWVFQKLLMADSRQS